MPTFSTQGLAENRGDFVNRLVDFLTNVVGWQMHDARSNATAGKVCFYSTGENGRERIYFYLNLASRLDTAVCQSWNSETNGAVKESWRSNYTYLNTNASSSFLFWIFADLDHVFMVSKISSYYYGCYLGNISRFNDGGGNAFLQIEAAKGENVVAAVDDASVLDISNPVIIADNTYIQRITIDEIDTTGTPNTIKINSLGETFSPGAIIGIDPQPTIVTHSSFPGTFYAANVHTGYHSSTSQTGNLYYPYDSVSYSQPNYRTGEYVLYPLTAVVTNNSYREYRGDLIDVKVCGAGSIQSEDVIVIGDERYKMFRSDSGYYGAICFAALEGTNVES